MNSSKNNQITIYGASWCGDCVRVKFYLDSQNIPYTYIDIDDNNKAAEYVESVNPNGYKSIPVITKGSIILIEPTIQQLKEKLI